MKRIGNIYKRIYDTDNLRLAHKKASKDKGHYKDVTMVNKDVDTYLIELQELLRTKTYKVSDYVIKDINDNGKSRRLMKLPYYPDRIVQWAIMLQIEKILLSTFTSFTFASVKNRGIHKASSLLERYLKDKENTVYCLKLDVKKFYPSIRHEILKELLAHKFKDKDLLELLFLIIDSMPGDVGIPIGSYLSQYFANFYMTYFDHWLKEKLKVRYVIRYMDDVIMLGKTKEYLHDVRKSIEEYLSTELALSLKGNWQVFPVEKRGIDFVGYRHFHEFRLLRKSIYKRFKARANKILRRCSDNQNIGKRDFWSINSHIGWLAWCNGYNLLRHYIQPVYNKLKSFYNKKQQGKEFDERFGNCKRKQRGSSTYCCR